MTTIQAPVNPREREKFMDILRGFAILGIFIANLNFMSLYHPEHTTGPFHYAIDRKVSFLHAMFIEGKFYSIFSLLFGWGLAMQYQRIKEKGSTSASFLRRRLWVMLLLGMCHLLILWTGDIVAFYAMLGFVLLLFRNAPDKRLLTWGTIFFLLPIVIYFFKMKFQWLNAPAGIVFGTGQKIEQAFHPEAAGGPFSMTAENTKTWIAIWKFNLAGFFFRFGYLFFVSRIWKVLGVFLIGFYVGRNNHYKNILNNTPLLRKVAIIGFAIGLPMNYMLARYMQNENAYWNLEMDGWYYTVVYALGVVPLGFAYAATLALAFKTAAGKTILSVLQPVGKMAFTNYIMHSLIGILTFYGVGLGLGGQFGPLAWTFFGICIFIMQIIFSYIWLSYFNFGPIEFLWRSMTYGKWQVMRKQPNTPSEMMAS